MKKKSTLRSAFFKLPVLAGVFVVLTGVFLALFAAANSPTSPESQNSSTTSGAPLPARVTARTFTRVTPDAVVLDPNRLKSEGDSVAARTPERRVIGPLGNILWMVDDQNAIADGGSIDANNVWGAWILNGARLSI